MFKKKFTFYRQLDQMDCGPTCLKMIAKYYGKDVPMKYLRENSFVGKQGASMKGLSQAAESLGFRTLVAKVNFDILAEKGKFPCIAYWRQNHFIVIIRIHKNKVYVADPAEGLITYSIDEFNKYWINNSQNQIDMGIIMFLEEGPNFHTTNSIFEETENDISFLFKYLKPYRAYFFQMFIGLFAGSLITLVMPFLMQSVVDVGINHRDIDYLYIILIAQTMFFVGYTSIDLIRSWIRLHIGARISIQIIADFLDKMMFLPMSFFDSKNVGDIRQRITDHYRIKDFITSSSLDTLFSLINLIVFTIIMFVFSSKIFLTFIIGSTLYFLWIFLFLKKRKILDYKKFNALASNQNTENYLIMGMPEIKLNNCEKEKRWEWEILQANIFEIGMQGLQLEQIQISGARVIHEFKNILILFLAAKSVIIGDMTLGMMMAISSIVGQLNNPLLQLTSFIRQAQDAQLSLHRLAEIHNIKGESNNTTYTLDTKDLAQDIVIDNVSFRYGNPNLPFILKNLTLTIPYGKTTAIVGSSGSGKTTLLKLLIKFYAPESGDINIGDYSLESISTEFWRTKCGAVMQDGFIFSDSIAKNIAVTGESIDKERLLYSAKAANILEMINKLPLKFNTKIGDSGIGLSAGQKQRILIARLIYRNPEFLFFDEATSALDANNEKTIVENLKEFMTNKTALIIAHRLSTVKNADQIVVLDKGQIAEIGTHTELTAKKGLYYELVKNQLELGD